jgi:hypothetical protein
MLNSTRALLGSVGAVSVVLIATGCFIPSQVVEFKLYPSPIFGHVAFDRDLTDAESFELDPEAVQRVLPKANWWPGSPVNKGNWLATMKTQDGREFRVRLDRFRHWFQVEGHLGYYMFLRDDDSKAFRELTKPGSRWIHQNEYRWGQEGVQMH